jgi:class 3 adenylate cyclase
MSAANDESATTGAAEHFPGRNPHPVMRLDTDGTVTYANAPSEPLLAAIGVEVGQRLPATWCARIEEAAASAEPIELQVGPRTFELLAVHLPDLGFTNLYGTDVTALKALVKFPNENPNPVFRLTWDGVIAYANRASEDLIAGLSGSVGHALPEAIHAPLLAAARAGSRERLEVESRGRRYELLAVDVPEFNFVNVYGTDTTAVRELELVSAENERLLLNVLPAPIADRIRRGERLIADRFDDVSLMFADIVEFTRLSSGMTADELVGVLNDVFTVFDRIVDKSGLEKVKTIGDAYMVVGGMSDPQPDHLARLAGMALELGRTIESIDACRRFSIRFRVGIHCGPVVAGVIGTKKFIYDVWGDTVNLASRMESTGIPGRIQVTPAVEERLRSAFQFDPRGVTEVKGVGPMSTFFLVGAAR